MKRSVRIKWTSLSMCTAVNVALLWWQVLDRFGAPSWAYGVMWSVVALLVFLFIVSIFTETRLDVPGFGEDRR